MSKPTAAIDLNAVWTALDGVKDPEIPTVSLVELGVVRTVTPTLTGVHVAMSPTFVGCPAIDMMRQDIVRCLNALGIAQVTVDLVFDPPWSSEMISETGRAKMKAFGLAPPPRHDGNFVLTLFESADCPHCASANTELDTPFGKTLCRSMWYCHDCHQSFDQFKPL